MPTPSPFSSRPARTVAVAVLALLWATAAVHAAPLVVDAAPADTAGIEVRPAVARVAADGAPTSFSVAVGADVTGDMLVTFRARDVEVDEVGVVSPASGRAASATVTRDSIRLQPGEQVTVEVVVTGDDPILLEARATPAEGAGDVARVHALVLPGLPDPAPQLVVDEDGIAGVMTDAATVLSLRVRGAETRTVEERLVLAGSPLVVTSGPPPWPTAATAVVTTEAGIVVRAAGPRDALLAVAAVALTLAVIALGLTARRQRQRQRHVVADEPAVS